MPTLGKTTDGGSNSNSSATRTSVSQYTAPSSGVIDSGTARIWLSASGTTQAKLVLYADSSDTPAALLAESGEQTITNTAEAAIDFTFSGGNRYSIVSGTKYWVGIAWLDPGTPGLTLSRDGTASARQENLSYAANPFGTPSAQSGPIDVFLNYIEPSDDGAFFQLF